MNLYACGCCHRWYDADRDRPAQPQCAGLNVPDPDTGEIQDQPHWVLVCPRCLTALQRQGSAPDRERM